MHIHALPASCHALAGAQAAEMSTALRRARELQAAALKLGAASFDPGLDLGLDPAANSEVVGMIGAWSGGSQPEGQPASPASKPQTQSPEVERTPPAGPVSYWV